MDKRTKEKIQEIANDTGWFDKLEDGSTLFFSSNFILNETPDRKVIVNPHCDLDPDIASIITLQLKDLFKKKEFFVDVMFTYKEDGSIVFGEDVIKIQEEQFEQEVQKRKSYDYLMYSDFGIEV